MDIIRIERPTSPLRGQVHAPADKSITHRALLFGALNRRATHILNPSVSADCLATANLLQTLGYRLVASQNQVTLFPPEAPLSRNSEPLWIDCHNSGTTARMSMGLLAATAGTFQLTGDDSLRKRPMERAAAPLRLLGASVEVANGTMPITIHGKEGLAGYQGDPIPVASAQVWTALALAGLRSRDGVILRQTTPMRDHSARMMEHLGMPLSTANSLSTIHPARLDAEVVISIPGDLSGAAFLVAGAVLVPGSHLVITDVGLNPTRIAFLQALRGMGAQVQWEVEREINNEPRGCITAEYSPDLRGIELDPANRKTQPAPSVAQMMDELPLLALVAARAEGSTVIRGAGELRVKESDRIRQTAAVLRALGGEVKELEDGFSITGVQELHGDCRIDHAGDHRICMMAAIAGLVTKQPVEIPNPSVAEVSFPKFWKALLGGRDQKRAEGGGIALVKG
ncbi:MAG: 3-phosphoshikimate 1-carboxyvinyltransferase [Armatimonadetes bacterium]|nr:3-phosphoshikimate 1-carboxyvinyltransferase [Armatimonadota bacterium]